MKDNLEWLRSLIIIGREDDDEGNDDGDDDLEDQEGDDDEGDDEGGDDEGEEESPEELRKALEKTKKALREERLKARKALREARRTTKKRTEAKDDKDLNETRQQLTSEQEKTSKLASRLLDRSRDQAILAEARKQGFIDETDALTDMVRNDVDFDQDDDDPSDIEIDSDSVKDAIAALIDKKPHLVGKNPDGTPTTPSGKRMGKKKNADEDKLSDEKLQEIYPGLR